jgi:hypothetical protein
MSDLVHFGPECPICFGLGWVCENHPKRACSEELGCQCGAGMPCECVSVDGLEGPDVNQVLEALNMALAPRSLPIMVRWAVDFRREIPSRCALQSMLGALHHD